MPHKLIPFGPSVNDVDILGATVKTINELIMDLYGITPEFHTNTRNFPATGVAGKVYIAVDTGYMYEWSGGAYVAAVAKEHRLARVSTDINNNTVGLVDPSTGLVMASTPSAAIAKFPSCKMFLRCRESSGTTMRDEVTGNSITVGASITRNGNAARIVSRSALLQISEALPSGAIAAGAHTLVLFAVYVPDENIQGISFVGTDENNHIHVQAPSSCAADIYDDGQAILAEHTFTNDSHTLDMPIGAAVTFTPGVGSVAKYYQTTGGAVVTDSTLTSATNAPGAVITNTPEFSKFKFNMAGGGKVLDAFAVGIFKFSSGVPADIETAVQWMTQKALEGDPQPYPGWYMKT